jgi:hypothetical protein
VNLPGDGETRAQLTAVEQELARLQAQHDLAMSAFKFDEANEVQRRIAQLERERARLAADLPEPQTMAPAAPFIPVLKRRPRLRRR